MQEPQVPTSDAIQFRTRARTRWSDEDNQNVLNNAVFLTLLEEARFDYFSALGLIEENRFPFLLAQCHLRFLRPGRGARQLEVEVATTRLGKSSFEQAYRVIDLESGDAWLEAVALLVCYDSETGASQPMTADFRRSVEACEGLAD